MPKLETSTQRVVERGRFYPLGATRESNGVNFALYSKHATHGFRFDEHKLLLDPYARAITASAPLCLRRTATSRRHAARWCYLRADDTSSCMRS